MPSQIYVQWIIIEKIKVNATEWEISFFITFINNKFSEKNTISYDQVVSKTTKFQKAYRFALFDLIIFINTIMSDSPMKIQLKNSKFCHNWSGKNWYWQKKRTPISVKLISSNLKNIDFYQMSVEKIQVRISCEENIQRKIFCISIIRRRI